MPFGNLKLKLKGLTEVTAKILGVQKILPVVVMVDTNPFGLQWSEMYNMTFSDLVYSVKPIQHSATLKQALNTFSSVFDDKPGRVKNYEINIHIKSRTVTKHVSARPVKFPMRQNTEVELQRSVDVTH